MILNFSGGLPCFIAGSVSFGLAQAGVVPAAAAGATLPVILGFSAAGIFLITLRLPLIYTAVFVLVDLALLLSFLGVNESSAGAAARCRSAARCSGRTSAGA